MSVDIQQNADGSMRLVGNDGTALSGFQITANPYNATSVDMVMFTASRACVVTGIIGRVDTAGTDAGAVTAQVRKVPSGTALTGGTVLHTGTYNLKGTANANQVLTLSTTDGALRLAAGDSIVLDFTGVLTAAAGCISVTCAPL
jgi:hypothetical protein